MLADVKKILSENNIILAMDSWNQHYNCYNPNNWPSNWQINGQLTIPTYYGRDWFDLKPGDVNLTDREIMQTRQHSLTIDHLYKKGGFWHLLVNNIPHGTKYIYPIQINRPGAITEDLDTAGYRYVSERVIQDVKKNLARIVLLMPYEGDFDTKTLDTIDHWSQQAGLEREHVYFVNANQLSEQYVTEKALRFTVVPVPTIFIPMFPKYRHTKLGETNQNIYTEAQPFQPKTTTRNLYLCYNRRPRYHRSLMLVELLKNHLWHRGMISFRPDLLPVGTMENIFAHDSSLREYARMLDYISPVELDMDLEANNPAVDVQPEHYAQTFLSLVPETCWESDRLFFSEKIWKTLRIGHPFILLGNPGSLAKLKEMGFKTFDQWWDESYDTEPQLPRRVQKIIKILKKLNQLSPAELGHLRQGMRSTVEHNQQLINELGSKMQDPQDQIAEAVSYIRGTF